MNRPIHGGNLAWAAALAGCPPDSISDFSASINPLGPPQSAIAAIQAHLQALRAYPDPDYHQLREALGQFHHLSPEWFLPGNGAAELLTWAGWELASLGATYLVTPAFGDYWRSLRAVNAQVIECSCWQQHRLGDEEDNHLFIPRISSYAWGESGLLINNPHNPTGQMFSRASLQPYLEEFALVAIDEAFMDFLPTEEQQSAIAWVQDYPNLVILRSLTKFYSVPGLRLGYAIAHPDRLRRWQKWRDPWPVNVLAAAAGVAMLADGEFQQQTWNWLPAARQQLFTGLGELPGLQPYPGKANFLLVGSELPSSQIQAKLLKHSQILIRDCLSFPELGDRYFRVAVRSLAENQRLISGLAAVLRE